MVNKYKKLSIVRKAKIELKEKVDKLSKCRHCDDSEPAYCEKCYQKLITENCKLQMENIQLCNDINSRGYWPYNPMKKYEPIATMHVGDEIIKDATEEGLERYAAFQQERADEINTGKVR